MPRRVDVRIPSLHASCDLYGFEVESYQLFKICITIVIKIVKNNYSHICRKLNKSYRIIQKTNKLCHRKGKTIMNSSIDGALTN